MTKEEIEYYHNSGLMPDWIYYQVNGKTAEENYRDILLKRNKEYRDLIVDRELKDTISKRLEETIDNCLDNIISKLGKN